MPEPATQTIRTRVTEACLQALSGDHTLGDAFVEEIRELLGQTKPPKAEAFVSVFEKYSESKPG